MRDRGNGLRVGQDRGSRGGGRLVGGHIVHGFDCGGCRTSRE